VRRRVLPALALAAATTLLPAAPALAINSYNSRPAPERTNVGALVVEWDGDGDGVRETRDWVCSGTMVDRNTFVTAAHCTYGWPAGTRFFVSLAQTMTAKTMAAAAEGTAHSDPAFPGNSSDTHDLAVIEVWQPRQLGKFTPAKLPTAGLLDQLGPKALSAQSWTVAGYGTQEGYRGPGGHYHPGGGERRQASVTFDALNATWVRLNMTAATGNGGACYGDSGGPNFTTVKGTELLVSTTITGDTPCYATNVTYRLDSASARAFLKPYVALP
jgi:hypothetical protein